MAEISSVEEEVSETVSYVGRLSTGGFASPSFIDRYVELCRSYGEEPHPSILARCSFASDMLSQGKPASLEISLCQLDENDVLGLVALLNTGCQGIDAVDIDAEESRLPPSVVLQILRAAGTKLRSVDLTNRHMGREVLKDIFHLGLPCFSLNLSGCHVRKLPLVGPFSRLHTLKLDHNHHITTLPENCFSRMPELSQLSLCATSVTNLWTASAALVRLSSLSELRFQQCDCCPLSTAACSFSQLGDKDSSRQQLKESLSSHAFKDPMSMMEVNANCSNGEALEAADKGTLAELTEQQDPTTIEEPLPLSVKNELYSAMQLRDSEANASSAQEADPNGGLEEMGRRMSCEFPFHLSPLGEVSYESTEPKQVNQEQCRSSSGSVNPLLWCAPIAPKTSWANVLTPEASEVQISDNIDISEWPKMLGGTSSGKLHGEMDEGRLLGGARENLSEPGLTPVSSQKMEEGPLVASIWSRRLDGESTLMNLDGHGSSAQELETTHTFCGLPTAEEQNLSMGEKEFAVVCQVGVPDGSVTNQQATDIGIDNKMTWFMSTKTEDKENCSLGVQRNHNYSSSVPRPFDIQGGICVNTLTSSVEEEGQGCNLRQWDISSESMQADRERNLIQWTEGGTFSHEDSGFASRDTSAHLASGGEDSLINGDRGWTDQSPLLEGERSVGTNEWATGTHAQGGGGGNASQIENGTSEAGEDEGSGYDSMMFGERWGNEAPFLEESHMEIILGGFEAPPPSPHLDSQRVWRGGPQGNSFETSLPAVNTPAGLPSETGGVEEDCIGNWEEDIASKRAKKHASPICDEQYYRPFLIAMLPNLQVLDNLGISIDERKEAQAVYIGKFEGLANGRKGRENLYHILQHREVGVAVSFVRRRGSGNARHKKQTEDFQKGLTEDGSLAGSSALLSVENPCVRQQQQSASVCQKDTAYSQPQYQESMGFPQDSASNTACLQAVKSWKLPEGPSDQRRPAVPPYPSSSLPSLVDNGGNNGAGLPRHNSIHSDGIVTNKTTVMDMPQKLRIGAAMGAGCQKEGSAGYRRALASARVAGCDWSEMMPMKILNGNGIDIHRRYRPRQFEYNPLEPHLMVVGTLQGEVLVVNHETGITVGQVQSIGAPHSILGLCWLNKDSSKLIGGCDNGSIQLYDVNHMRASHVASLRRNMPAVSTPRSPEMTPLGRLNNTRSPAGGPLPSIPRSPALYTYEDFEQLTSVHINCTDDVFLASGYSNDVGLYDLRTGRRLQIFPNLHQEHINVLKFSHHSPHLFATSSFDRAIKLWDARQNISSRGPIYTAHSDNPNVMVCFSHDDYFLLSSAVDNEVRQHLAADGRLHLKLDLKPSRSSHNYTRAYYMNGRDYIISGSCEENAVRICCAQTGRQLRDVAFEGHGHVGRGSKTNPYVQSLRGDPAKDFNFGVLVAYHHPTSRSEIIKVNLMSGSAKNGERETRTVPPAGLGA